MSFFKENAFETANWWSFRSGFAVLIPLEDSHLIFIYLNFLLAKYCYYFRVVCYHGMLVLSYHEYLLVNFILSFNFLHWDNATLVPAIACNGVQECHILQVCPKIILCMLPANERWCYIVMSSHWRIRKMIYKRSYITSDDSYTMRRCGFQDNNTYCTNIIALLLHGT